MAGVSDDDLLKAMGTEPANVSDADLLGQMGAAQDQPRAAAPAAPTAKGPLVTGYQDFGAGLVRGAKSAIGSVVPIDAWISNKLGFPGEAARLKNNLAAFQGQGPAFDQQHGLMGQLGQVGGAVATSLPAMMVGGEGAGLAAAGLSKGLPAVAPALDFLSGATKGNKLLSLASKGTQGAIQGTAAAGLTSGGSNQPLGQQLMQGGETGGFLGVAGPAAANAGSAVYNKLTGGGISPLKAALAKKAINEFGIPLRGSQISNSPFAHYLDSTVGKIPFAGLEAQNEAQRTAFTKAVAGTMGSDADNLTPPVMAGIRKALGNNYNQVAARTSIPIDGLGVALGNVVSEASQVLPEGDLKPLTNQVERILGSSENGIISGKTYKALTADGAPLDRATQSKDPNVRHYASMMERALNDALTASATPEDAALLKQTNRQWKNMRTVQDLAAKAGIEGEITPTALLGAVKKSYKDMAYSGAGQIGDLAHIGQQFLSSPPSSGTGERQALYALLGMGGEAGTEALFHNPDALLHAAALGAGTVTAGRLIGHGLKSHAYRDYLLNSVVRQQGGNALFRGATQIPGGVNQLALPAGVIGANQLMFNRSPVPSAP